jgi:tetratricopeptide (TPR) repeat protein
MEGTKNKIRGLIILLLVPVLMSTAQKKDLAYYQCAFFESYRAGNMSAWPSLIAEMEKVKSTELVWQGEMVKARSGLVGYPIGAKRKNLARAYVNKADVYLEKLLEAHPQNAQLHSLAGAFYGYKIGLAFYKAPFLGPKCIYHLDKAIELNPKEPMGYIERGNSLMYRPAAFGGDKNEALKVYRKALALIEANHPPRCSWQHLLLRAFILKALYETDQPTEAKAFLLAMEKDYGSMEWIKAFVGNDLMVGK